MLPGLLAKNRNAILKKWFNAVLETYPPDSRQFFSKKEAPFANPVGSTVYQALESAFDFLLAEDEGVDIPVCLNDLMKVRAVQELPWLRLLVSYWV